MDRYPVYEIFASVQGEGANTGRAAVFVRLAGCPVECEWCDSKGAQSTQAAQWLTAKEISERVLRISGSKLPIVITGGEPTVYDLTTLTDVLHGAGHELWLETSGTEPIRGCFDWICLSPKQHHLLYAEDLSKADEIKVVIVCEKDLTFAEQIRELMMKVQGGSKLYLQPEWGSRNTAIPLIVEYIERNPEWRLSLQTHKYIGVE